MKKLNLVWRQVIKLRQQHRWTQEQLAVELNHAGWHNATRSTVSKIEGGTIHIAEYDVLILAEALRVELNQIYPPIDRSRPMDETIHLHLPYEIHGDSSDPNQKKPLCQTKLKPKTPADPIYS